MQDFLLPPHPVTWRGGHCPSREAPSPGTLGRSHANLAPCCHGNAPSPRLRPPPSGPTEPGAGSPLPLPPFAALAPQAADPAVGRVQVRCGHNGRPGSRPSVGVAARANLALRRLPVSAWLTWAPAGLRGPDSNRLLPRAPRGRNLPPAAQRERPGLPPHWPAARVPHPTSPHWLLGAPRLPCTYAHWPHSPCHAPPLPIGSPPAPPPAVPRCGRGLAAPSGWGSLGPLTPEACELRGSASRPGTRGRRVGQVSGPIPGPTCSQDAQFDVSPFWEGRRPGTPQARQGPFDPAFLGLAAAVGRDRGRGRG